MHLSSILVFVQPEHFDQTCQQLAELPNIKIYYRCSSSGRIILIQEQTDIDRQIQGIQQIKAQQHVLTADLIYHYVEPDATPEQKSLLKAEADAQWA